MELPTMPRQANRRFQAVKRGEEIIEFRGLNRTENTRNGELKHAVNLSTANYPCISQRGKRVPMIEYVNPTDIFEWDGNFVVVDDGNLFYNGEFLSEVEPGQKQFAVVNTKLCIFPDKTYIDLTTGKYERLDGKVVTSGAVGSVVIQNSNDGSTFKSELRPKEQGVETFAGSYIYDLDDDPPVRLVTYSYGTDAAAVAACFDESWDLEALEALESTKSLIATSTGTRLAQGDIFIPRKNGVQSYMIVDNGRGDNPDVSKYNTDGVYGIVSNRDVELIAPGVFKNTYYADFYRVTSENPLFSAVFSVGDAVDIVGTKDGACDVKRAIIRAIDDTTNTLTFDRDTLVPPENYDTSEYNVEINRFVPDMDFVCEKDNRLWGVSNSTENEIRNAETGEIETFTSRAVYASALGDPKNFWVFDGLDTDSYQVAIGSEGNFTGVCAFGGGVCCWKEHKLHKIVGGFPSEYYMTDSSIEGVADGSSRSLTVINETLYYNGVTGVYAFSGGTPTLIGYELGRTLSNASGGTDGLRWYLSGELPDGTHELLAYDLKHGLWMREDASDATAFAMTGGELRMLADGTVYRTEQGADSDIEWLAEFTTFTETEIVKKYYLRLVLRLDMSANSSVKVEVREDFGEWRTVHAADVTAELAKVVNTPVKRCDRFDVRVSGTGNVLLRAMTREYVRGSER